MIDSKIRVLLILGSLLTMGFMLRRIRRSKVQIKDSISWILFAIFLLILSIFPQLASWASLKLHFEAPINFVYLFVIFLLLVQSFASSLRVSQMDAKMRHLAQRLALHEKNAEAFTAQHNPQPEHKDDSPL